jgi:hypothetical protein
MDRRQHVQFLRCEAHECRVRASTMKHPETEHWLNLAREYDRQADQLESLITGPSGVATMP